MFVNFDSGYNNPKIWEAGGARYNIKEISELIRKEGITKAFKHNALKWFLEDLIEYDLAYRYGDLADWQWVALIFLTKAHIIIHQNRILNGIIGLAETTCEAYGIIKN